MTLSRDCIQFNPLKHHLQFACKVLVENLSGNDKMDLLESLKSVNSNFVDIYTGNFTPGEIIEKLLDELLQLNVYKQSDYLDWLGERGFRMLTLPDGANWVLRKSETKGTLVHIHPSRIPPLTIRVHGNAWKTSLGLLLRYPEYLKQKPTLEQINRFRKEFLELSPVKGIENLKRVLNADELIHSCICFGSKV